MKQFEFIVTHDLDYMKAVTKLNNAIREKYSNQDVSIHSINSSQQLIQVPSSLQFPQGGQAMMQIVTALIVHNQEEIDVQTDKMFNAMKTVGNQFKEADI